jgi:hypothetical protein
LDRSSTVTTPGRVEGGSLSETPTFVELPTLQSPPHGHVVVRLLGRDGEQMEIMGGIEVVAIVREFWNRAR